MTLFANYHRATEVEYRGQQVQIDNDILPLIQLFWSVGLETHHCCQGGYQPAYVKFEADSFRRVAKILGAEHQKTDRSRVKLDSASVQVDRANTGIYFDGEHLETVYQWFIKVLKGK